MNTYTLDPPTSEPIIASTPVPVSAPIFTPSYHQYPIASNVQSDIQKIRDWLPWSIISFFIGGILLGFLPLIFSLICRSNKKYNERHSARLMSTLALIFNIIITMIGITVLIGLFIYIFVFTQTVRTYV
jgi:thiol:disulfide interchange protein